MLPFAQRLHGLREIARPDVAPRHDEKGDNDADTVVEQALDTGRPFAREPGAARDQRDPHRFPGNFIKHQRQHLERIAHAEQAHQRQRGEHRLGQPAHHIPVRRFEQQLLPDHAAHDQRHQQEEKSHRVDLPHGDGREGGCVGCWHGFVTFPVGALSY